MRKLIASWTVATWGAAAVLAPSKAYSQQRTWLNYGPTTAPVLVANVESSSIISLSMLPRGFAVLVTASPNVRAYTREGELRWSSAIDGNGYLFARATTLSRGPHDDVIVADARSQLVSSFSEDGRVLCAVRLEEEFAHALWVTKTRFYVSSDSHVSAEVGTAGRVARTLRWPDSVKGLYHFSREEMIATDGHGRVAHVFDWTGGGRLFDLERGTEARIAAIEEAVFPETVSVTRGAVRIIRVSPSARRVAEAIALTETTLAVSRRDSEQENASVVDFYASASGLYKGSIRLEVRARALSLMGDTLFALAGAPYSSLFVWHVDLSKREARIKRSKNSGAAESQSIKDSAQSKRRDAKRQRL